MYRQSEKNLLNANTSFTCRHNMVIFGSLTAEIGSGVWGTPAYFNRFCILAALLHSIRVVGVSQTAALNRAYRGRHLYLAGRPSRWALAHILVMQLLSHVISHVFVVLSCLVNVASLLYVNSVCLLSCLVSMT